MLHRFIAPLLAAGFVAVTPAAQSGDAGGEIIFAHEDASLPRDELFVLPLGGAPRGLSRSQGRGGTLTLAGVSPDGRHVALVRFGDTANMYDANLYLARVDGRGERRIARDVPRGGAVTWSPDGRRVAFAPDVERRFAEPDEVHIVRSDGTGRRKLAGDASSPVWSPDGSRIAIRAKGDKHLLHIVRPDGHGLWSTPGLDPVWSPDGSLVAVRRTPERGRVRTVVLNASGAIWAIGAGELPAWSPDGSRITLTRGLDFPAGERGTFVRELASGRATRVGAPGTQPVWSASGHLAFGADGGVWVLEPGARTARRRFEGAPIGFSLDGRRLAGKRTIIEGSFDSTREELWVATADGQRPRRLLVAPDGSSLWGAAWAGSSALVYHRERTFVDSDLYAVQSSGEDLRRIYGSRFRETSPALSPDRSTIVFARSEEPFDARIGGGGSVALWTVPARGGTAIRLTSPGEGVTYDWDAEWSPDGSRIVFARSTGADSWLRIIDLAAGTQSTRLRTEKRAGDPAWSPDGTLIAYAHDWEADAGISVIRPDGTGRRILVPDVNDLTGTAWSPDGLSLAFADDEAVFVARADGTEVRRITRGRGPIAWSADGTRLVFTDDPCTATICANLWSVALDGSDRRRLTRGAGADLDPDWRS